MAAVGTALNCSRRYWEGDFAEMKRERAKAGWLLLLEAPSVSLPGFPDHWPLYSSSSVHSVFSKHSCASDPKCFFNSNPFNFLNTLGKFPMLMYGAFYLYFTTIKKKIAATCGHLGFTTGQVQITHHRELYSVWGASHSFIDSFILLSRQSIHAEYLLGTSLCACVRNSRRPSWHTPHPCHLL